LTRVDGPLLNAPHRIRGWIVRRRRGWLVVGAAALAVAVGAPVAVAAGTKTGADPAGDAGAGFDITSLTVSNDNAGVITFRIAVPAVAALPDNFAVGIALDTDLTSEGSPVDYVITAVRNVAVLVPINAAGAGAPFIPRSLTTTFEPGVVSIAIDRKDLGSPRALLLSVTSFTVAPGGAPITDVNTDVAPAGGVLLYPLKLPTRLAVRSTVFSPKPPVPGSRFRAGVFVRDVTFGAPGEPAQGGRVTCRFTVGGAKVTAARSLTKAGRATCAGNVPLDAAGESIRGTLTYALNGAVVTARFTGTVRS
jgi:hypothetical protein